jgi:hypothetical protein
VLACPVKISPGRSPDLTMLHRTAQRAHACTRSNAAAPDDKLNLSIGHPVSALVFPLDLMRKSISKILPRRLSGSIRRNLVSALGRFSKSHHDYSKTEGVSSSSMVILTRNVIQQALPSTSLALVDLALLLVGIWFENMVESSRSIPLYRCLVVDTKERSRS